MINVRIPDEETQLSPRIVVVGAGGGGGNAVANMIESNLEGVEFLVCNTDAQALENNPAERKIQLGANITRGLGGGARPDVGRAATEETIDEITGYLDGANMVFITAGMGGATGTGGAPVIARAAREMGILTVGVVTKPFHFEGQHRMRIAEAGIEELQQYVDTLLVIPNQNLFRIANEKTTFADAFRMADHVLHSGVRGVTDLIVMPGLINLDFADIRSVMAEMGKAMMGTGEAEGDNRAVEAAEAAISNPLLEDVSMEGARGILINITGGMDMTLFEVDEACNRIRDEVDPEANIIFGSTFNEALDGKMRVSVVATGIDSAIRQQDITDTTPATRAQAKPEPKETKSGLFTGRSNTEAPKPKTGGGFFGGATGGDTGTTTATSTPSNQETAPAAEKTQTVAQSSTTETGNVQSSAKDNASSFFTSGSTAFKADPVPEKETETETADNSESQITSDNSFIPPEAVVVEEDAVISKQQAPQSPVTVSELKSETKEDTNKSASLFDRLTGRAPKKEEEATDKDKTTTTSSEGTGGLTLTAADDQGEDKGSSPSLTSSSDDDLDIPAFLRRQAN